MTIKEEKNIRETFEKNLDILKNNGRPDIGDILKAGGFSDYDIRMHRKYVLIYTLTEDVIDAASKLLNHYKCKECGNKGNCSGCPNKILRKTIRLWKKFEKEYDI